MKNWITVFATLFGISSMGMAYYAPSATEQNLRDIEAVSKNQEIRDAFRGDLGIQSIIRGDTDDTGTRYYVRSGHCTAFIRVLPISIALDPSKRETRFEGMACE